MPVLFADSLFEVDVIPTGLFIDKLSGVGGVPRGVITEIYGDESIGKSTVCMQIVAAAQKQGLRCLWADVEWSYSPLYAQTLGVDNAALGILRESLAETVLDAIEEEAQGGKWDLIVLDAVGSILPKDEAEKDSEGKTIGGQARLIAKFCRKITPILKTKNVAFIAINHSSVDIMSGAIVTSGGKKLRYHKQLSIQLKKKFGGRALTQGDRKVGEVVVGEVKKNKLAGNKGLLIESQLLFGTGFSAAADLFGDALEKAVITKKGNTYYFHGEKLGIGMGQARKKIEEDPALMEELKKEAYATN